MKCAPPINTVRSFVEWRKPTNLFSALPINIIAIPKKQNSFFFANQHHRSNLLLANTLPLHTSPSSFLLLPLILPLLPPLKEEEEVYMGTQKIQKFQKFGQILK